MLSRDFAKLDHILRLLRPGLVFAADGTRFERALARAAAQGAQILVSRDPPPGALTLAELESQRPGQEVDHAFAQVGPDTVAKFLFTSGSTDHPKAVVNTQRMLCSNQQAIAQLWPFLKEEPPVLVDWLPWSHTFGGNQNFGMVLCHGGSLYIDEGRPVPGGIAPTIANLRELSPTMYFNVPRGFDALLPHLEGDPPFRDTFFRRLQLLFYAGAALPQSLWRRLDALAHETRGASIPFVSGWGATETAPMVTLVHFPTGGASVIGLPGPGCEVKLVPTDGKQELRVRGPNVTPGYWRNEELTAAAFDEEGFYRTGDAGRLADPERPERGIEFDGRIAEDFKLSSGTWVRVGALRVRAIAAFAPVAQDVVVAGADRDRIALLVFPSVGACRRLCPDLGDDASGVEIERHPAVRARVADGLRAMASTGAGSSQRPARALLVSEPPSIDANEITDKGYLNQRAVLARRADVVERLYAEPPSSDVIVFEEHDAKETQ